jgi:hypothetical protein
MENTWDKSEIRKRLLDGCKDIHEELVNMEKSLIHKKEGEKWSIADEVMHLIQSGETLLRILSSPPFLLKKFGVPNRPLRNYDEIVERFYEKQQKIGKLKAPDQFTKLAPKELTPGQLSKKLERTYTKVSKALSLWSEKRLNSSLIPHPLFGRLISREMLYFVIFHNAYHLEGIKSKYKNLSE